MLISINWLKELVIGLENISLNQMIEKLIFNGIEIKNVYKLCDVNNLIVGQVIKCDRIPKTHLSVCQINLGNEIGIKQIVCGASNIRNNLKVIVALPGARVLGKTINSSIIHGFESYGMCCGLSEICLTKIDDEDKIYELSDDYQIGEKKIINLLGFDDIILDVTLLANRADLQSVYYLAMEIAGLFNCKLKPLNIKQYIGTKNVDFKILNKTSKCLFFAVRILKNTVVKESPDFLKKYLISMGVKPINNIVDIGNYVMLLTGHPLHIYDYDQLPKHELIVEEGYQDVFLALNKQKYQITKDDVVVTSNHNIMCLAGIIGSDVSACSIHTKNIVIEAANFDSVNIRHSAIRLNLRNESSNRFIHGVGNQQQKAIELATSLIEKYCGFDFISEIISIHDKKKEKKEIVFEINEINKILGTNFDLETIINVLKKNYFDIKKKDDFILTVLVPAHRIDINNIYDLAEEIIRYIGFDHVKDDFPFMQLKAGLLNDVQQKKIEIKKYLRNYLYEVSTYVLVNLKKINLFNYLNIHELPYQLVNPMSDDHLYVRKNLISSLLDVVSYNLARQNKNFGIFEISNVDYPRNNNEIHLAIAVTGEQKIQGDLIKIPYSFFSLKGFFNGIIEILNLDINQFNFKEFDYQQQEFHPSRSAFIYFNNQMVGYLGELHPNIYHCFNIKNNIVLTMEINLSFLFSMKNNNFKFIPFSNFPSVKRDLSLIIDSHLKMVDVINLVKKNGGPLVKDVNIFDVYKNKNYLDKKLVAISIILSDKNATLTEEEIKKVMCQIQNSLIKNGIVIRDS